MAELVTRSGSRIKGSSGRRCVTPTRCVSQWLWQCLSHESNSSSSCGFGSIMGEAYEVTLCFSGWPWAGEVWGTHLVPNSPSPNSLYFSNMASICWLSTQNPLPPALGIKPAYFFLQACSDSLHSSMLILFSPLLHTGHASLNSHFSWSFPLFCHSMTRYPYFLSSQRAGTMSTSFAPTLRILPYHET